MKFSKEIGYPFFEASAKDGTNIDECFDSLIKQIYNNYINSPVNDDNIKISNNNKNNESKDAAKYILNILFHFIDINDLVLINNINFIKIKNKLN